MILNPDVLGLINKFYNQLIVYHDLQEQANDILQ